LDKLVKFTGSVENGDHHAAKDRVIDNFRTASHSFVENVKIKSIKNKKLNCDMLDDARVLFKFIAETESYRFFFISR